MCHCTLREHYVREFHRAIGRVADVPAARDRVRPEVSGTVWVVSELYYPEQTSTGHILTCLAEGLARTHTVRVITGQPTYASRGEKAPARETRNNVRIERCWSTTLNKDNLGFRLLNACTFSTTAFVRAVTRFRKGDTVFVVTNPPTLPFPVVTAAKLRRATTTLVIHDVYPEALVAAGVAKQESLLARITGSAMRRLYRTVDHLVVLGRDMEALVRAKLRPIREGSPFIHVIPNWADLNDVRPEDRSSNPLLREHGLDAKFVVQHAGNIGRTHDVESMLRIARALRSSPEFHFLFIGSGAKEVFLRETVRREQLGNITLLGRLPQSDRSTFLNACDIAVIAFVPDMAGVSVPSRIYNIMASGKPILALADENSELARVVRENQIGWVVPPGDVDAALRILRDARDNPSGLGIMGARARSVAEREYSIERAIGAYSELASSGDLHFAGGSRIHDRVARG